MAPAPWPVTEAEVVGVGSLDSKLYALHKLLHHSVSVSSTVKWG